MDAKEKGHPERALSPASIGSTGPSSPTITGYRTLRKMPKSASLSSNSSQAFEIPGDAVAHQRTPSDTHSTARNIPTNRNGAMSPSSPTSQTSLRKDQGLRQDNGSSSIRHVAAGDGLFLDPPEPLYGKSQNSSSTSLPPISPPATANSTTNAPSSPATGDEDGSASKSVPLGKGRQGSESGEQAQNKKGPPNKRYLQILGRAQSIRTNEAPDANPKPSRSRTFARHLTPTPKERPGKDASPQTAPLEPEAGFREMVLSRNRNRSADRSQKESEAGQSLSAPPQPRVPKQNSAANVFMSNIVTSSTKAAEELRSAGRGFFGRFHRERAPPEKYTNLDNYQFKIINLPLHDQTRVSRIAKSMGDACDKTQYWMPALPYRAIEYLNLHGTEEEGLYRLSGSAREIKKWQVKFDTGPNYDVQLLNEEELHDINAISSMFKAWLRELPDEILPKRVQDRVAAFCAGNSSPSTTPQMFRDELSQLPPQNYYLLFAITCHISLLHTNSDKNKMNYQNLCICFQPCMKMDALCFQFLVCDWRNCWQGCWTESEYIKKEAEALAALSLVDTNASQETSELPGSLDIGDSDGDDFKQQANTKDDKSGNGSITGPAPVRPPREDEKVPVQMKENASAAQAEDPSVEGDVDNSDDDEKAKPADAAASQQKNVSSRPSSPGGAPTLAPVVPMSPMRGF